MARKSRTAGIVATVACVAASMAVWQAFADTTSISGGTITYDGDYVIHTFTNATSTFVLTRDVVADVLLVGGGGGGGSSNTGGGGGGAGGVVYRQNVVLTADTYEITVGAGGAGGSSNNMGGNGVKSTAFGLIAHGGGGGGGKGRAGTSAASGGGGACDYLTTSISVKAGGTSVYAGEGHAGGASTNGTITGGSQYHTHCWAGGGGGAGGPGSDGVCTAEGSTSQTTTGHAGVGGTGVPCSITGSVVYYGDGGGGGFADYSQPTAAGSVPGGAGGSGGAGSGSKTYGTPYNGFPGMDGRGGGGGGSGGFGSLGAGVGGKGGCGVVIVRYRLDFDRPFESCVAEGGTKKRDSGYSVFTFTNNGTFTVTGNSRVDILVVGGGGGGGSSNTGGGGGGGGGVVYKTSLSLLEGSYDIVVGAGGLGGTGGTAAGVGAGATGGDSAAFGITAHGGGGGGGMNMTGLPGASGGGGACYYAQNVPSPRRGGAASYGSVEGYAGGSSTNENNTTGVNQYHVHCWAGGGGGAGERGHNGVCTAVGPNSQETTGYAGAGGNGRACSITGVEVYYGGGGGGGFADYSYVKTGGTVAGGRDGGGNGSGCNTTTSQWDGYPGIDGLGGGGGGSGGFITVARDGGNGGCGTVIIRCRVRPVGMALVFR